MSTRRCGWAVVAAELNQDGIISRHTEAYGPLPGCHQNVAAAELFAFLFYLRHATSVNGQYIFYSDCAYVVDGFYSGRQTNTHGWAVDADLWKSVFDKVDDLGSDIVWVVKIKAHRKVTDAIGDFDRMQIVANSRADALAKLGVDLHPDAQVQRKSCYSDALIYKQIVQYMTRCLAFAMDNQLYTEIQDRHLELISVSSKKFDPDSLASKHFFTKLCQGAFKTRCVKCFFTVHVSCAAR